LLLASGSQLAPSSHPLSAFPLTTPPQAIGYWLLTIGYWLFPILGRDFNFLAAKIVYAMGLGVSRHSFALKH
jgi:hypothetical protein